MDSAIDRYTGKIVDGEQLWYINPVDKDGYICRGCRVKVNPVSFKPENKTRPHFKELSNNPHRSFCDIDGEVKLISRGGKERITTQNGFPGSFPSKLKLVDERQKVDIDSSITVGRDRSLSEMNSIGTTTEKRHLQWTASTIRPICRTFMNFPHDRDLPLNVPGTSGKIYDQVIRKLSSSDIVLYPSSHIFVAPLHWKKPEDVEGKIIIKLSCGLWDGNKLVQPYRLIVNSITWSIAKKNYILKELELSIKEAQKRSNTGKKSEKSWVFFIGEQDYVNPSDFIITDHRLICCLTGELFNVKYAIIK